MRSTLSPRSPIYRLLACFLGPLLATPWVLAAAPAIVDAGPTGTQREVRQVRMRFSDDMVALGDRLAKDPAQVTCSDPARKAVGHWIDPRNWVGEFAQPLPDGLACSVAPRADLRTLAGAAVAKARSWSFNTGGPRASMEAARSPRDGMMLLEAPVALFVPSVAVDTASLKRHLTCTVDGRAQAVRILSGAVRDAAIASWQENSQRKDDTRSWLAARCGAKPWRNGADVNWVWGKGIRSTHGVSSLADVSYRAQVRGALDYSVTCTQLEGKAGCDPRGPVMLSFSELVRLKGALILEGSSGKRYAMEPQQCREGGACAVFKSRDQFVENETLSVALDQQVTDVTGRRLGANVRKPAPIVIARQPVHVGQVSRGGVVPWLPGQRVRWPIALRNTEAQVAVRRWRISAAPGDLAALLALHRDAAGGRLRTYDGHPRAEAFDAGTRLLKQYGAHAEAVVEDRLVPSSPAMEFAGLPLSGFGTWLVEVDSPGFRARQVAEAAARRARRGAASEGVHLAFESELDTARLALVQLTNLRIHGRISSQYPSLVWVTAIDSGKPVANASVSVVDCKGESLFDGVSDGQGRVHIGKPLYKGGCDQAASWVWIVARDGDDICVLQQQGINAPPQAPKPVSHIILDRPLYSAGDTVSLQSLVRLPVRDGYAIPDATQLTLMITHSSGTVVLEEPLRFDAHGSAVAQWRVPSDAKLGSYHVSLTDPHRSWSSYANYTAFQVEEFRLPAFEASLNGKLTRQGDDQALALTGRLRFLAGGTADGHPVTIKGRYQAGAPDPMNGYSFDDASADADKLPDFAAIEATLDAQGVHQATVAAPRLARPATLVAEMEFADASGETKVEPLRLSLWPKGQKLGLTTKPGVVQGSAEFSVVVLDEENLPVSGKVVTIDAAHANFVPNQYPKTAVDHATWADVCTVRTDDSGQGACTVPWTRKAPHYFVFRASAAGALTAAHMKHASAFDWMRRSNAVSLVAGTEPAAGTPVALQVRAPFVPATLLLSVEREGVLASQVHAITSDTQQVTLASSPHFAPGVSIEARFVQGAGADFASVLPNKQLEHAENLRVMFSRATHRLDVKVMLAHKTAKPGQTVAAKVTVSRDGRAASGARATLIAVDDALLSLLPNGTWSPLDTFWRARYVAMTGLQSSLNWPASFRYGLAPDYWPAAERRTSAMMLASPAPAFGEDTQAVTVVGRRASVQSSMSRKAMAEDSVVANDVGNFAEGNVLNLLGEPQARTNFSSLALWQADVVLDREGQAEVNIPLPDSLTRWRIVAVAMDGTDRYGKGETTIQTRKDLQIVSGLPQTVRGDDVLRQKIVVRNAGEQALTVRLNAQAQALDGQGKPVATDAQGLKLERRLNLAAGQRQTVDWLVKVPDGVERLEWKFVAQSAGDGDALVVAQKVVNVPVTVRESTLVHLDQTHSIPVMRPQGAQPGKGGVAVTWRSSLSEAAMAGARAWMAAYPHRCMEQMTSRAVASGNRAEWDRVMALLPKHLDGDGLVQYFPNTAGSENLTAYLLDISSAQQLPLPPDERAKMVAALQKALSKDVPRDWMPEQGRLAHRLALQAALNGELGPAKPVVPADLNLLPTIALLDWVRHVLTTADAPLRQSRLEAAANSLRNRYELQATRLLWRSDHLNTHWWMMWTGDVVAARTALLVQQWAKVDTRWKEDLPRLVLALIDRQRNGHWDTTVGNVWGITALTRFDREVEGGPPSGVSHAAMAGEQVQSAWPQPASVLLPWQKDGARATLELKHAGRGKPWAAVQVKAAMKLDAPVSHGLAVRKTIGAVQRKVEGQWSEGDVMKVTLEIESHGDASWLAINDPIPSGSTIMGKGLGGESALAQAAGADKGWSWWSFPSHVERASDSYRAYYQRVSRGSWKLSYLVRLNNAGTFSFPATRVEAMYAPEIFAESPNEVLEVRP